MITLIDLLIKYQVLDLEKLMLKIYPKLNILPDEAIMLIHLISLSSQNNYQKHFPLSYKAINLKTGLDNKKSGLILKSLIEKGFIDICLEKKSNNKEQQFIDINGLFNKIELFLNKEIEEEKQRSDEANLKEVISLFELELQRSLTPAEIELIVSNKNVYKKSDYENAILEVSIKKNVTIKNVIDYLRRDRFINQEVSKQDEESIRSFLEQINRKP